MRRAYRSAAVLFLTVGVALSCAGQSRPVVAPAAAAEPLTIAEPSRASAFPTSGSTLDLEDLPGGWWVTKDRVSAARELAADADELETLERDGFVQHRQREFENYYGGTARELLISVSRFRDPTGASARVAYAADFTRKSAADIRVHSLGSLGLELDEAHAMRLDRGASDIAYVVYFRIGSWSVGVMAIGYDERSTREFFVHATTRQAQKLRGLVLESDGR